MPLSPEQRELLDRIADRKERAYSEAASAYAEARRVAAAAGNVNECLRLTREYLVTARELGSKLQALIELQASDNEELRAAGGA